MKITIKPKDTGKHNYMNIFNCLIAKGLRRRFIFAIVGGSTWEGLFLGIIPVWGTIPFEVTTRIIEISKSKIETNVTYEIGLYK